MKMINKLMLLIVSITLASCSMDKLNESIGGFSAQSPVQQTTFVTATTVNVLLLKKAFTEVNKDWHLAKRNFDIGKIPDKKDRESVRLAVETISATLAAMTSVRKGNIVDVTILVEDLVMFRANLRQSTAVLRHNLELHGHVTTDERRILFRKIIRNLERITSKQWDFVDTKDKRLIEYLEAISEVAKLLKEFSE